MSGRGTGDFKDAGIYEDSGLLKQVMDKFSVDEKMANRIIAFAVCISLDENKKWRGNYRRLQKQKAEEIYDLTKKLKIADFKKKSILYYRNLINEIEKKILELCIEHE